MSLDYKERHKNGYFTVRLTVSHKTNYQLVHGCNNVIIVRKIITIIITMILLTIMVFFSNLPEGNIEMSFVHASLDPQISQFQMLCKVGQNFMKTM